MGGGGVQAQIQEFIIEARPVLARVRGPPRSLAGPGQRPMAGGGEGGVFLKLLGIRSLRSL